MTLDHVGHAETLNTSGSTTCVVTRPAAATEGRLMLAHAVLTGVTAFTAPADWTAIGSPQDSGSNLRSQAYYKVCGASEPTTYTWSWALARRNFVTIDVYDGQHPVTPVAASASGAAASTATHPTPTVAVPAGGRLITMAGARYADAPQATWTNATGTDTERFDNGSAGAGATNQNISGAVYDSGEVATAGSLGRTLTSSRTVDTVVVSSIALAAAETPPPPAGPTPYGWMPIPRIGAREDVSDPDPGDPIGVFNNAEGGTHGASVTTTDTASGEPWATVSIGPDATGRWTNAQAADGNLSIETATGATSTSAYHAWGLGTATTDQIRVNVRLATLATRTLIRWMDGTDQCLRIGVDGDGEITVRDSANTLLHTGAVSLGTGAWRRIEAQVAFSATVGAIELRLWLDHTDSGAPDETITLTNRNFRAQATEIRWGMPASAANAVTVLMDSFAAKGPPGTWFGPASSGPSGGLLALGATAKLNDTALTFATFPGCTYFRDFGQSSGGTTVLTPHGTGKLALAPAGSIPHVSWKGAVSGLSSWLTGATRDYWLSWYHEPMGNVAPATYRSTAAQITTILASHPNAARIVGHGPVLTRYWLDQAGGDPADFMYSGATFLGVDCYNGSSTMYRTPANMFNGALAAARRFGVPLLVPEWGIERITTDTTGSGRAAAISAQVAYLRSQPDVAAVAWWNIGGDRITGLEPEQSTLQQLIAEQS